MKKIKLIIKIISVIIVIIPLITCIAFNLNKSYSGTEFIDGTRVIYVRVDYIKFIIIELINIMIMLKMLTSKKEITKKFLMIFIVFFIISVLNPIYYIRKEITPTGPKSELMGLGLKKELKNIYWIDVTNFVEMWE